MDSLRDKPPPYQELHQEEEGSPSRSAGQSAASVYPKVGQINYNDGPVSTMPASAPYPVQQHQQLQQQQPVILTQPSQPAQTVIVVNGAGRVGGKARCSACNFGQLKNNYPCCAWLLCIFCFPLGGCFCCLCMRNKKCNHCGIEF